MNVGTAICIEDWHVQAENGDRQECRRGKEYTITEPNGCDDVTLFSGFWVRAPARIFGGWKPLSQHSKDKP